MRVTRPVAGVADDVADEAVAAAIRTIDPARPQADGAQPVFGDEGSDQRLAGHLARAIDRGRPARRLLRDDGLADIAVDADRGAEDEAPDLPAPRDIEEAGGPADIGVDDGERLARRHHRAGDRAAMDDRLDPHRRRRSVRVRSHRRARARKRSASPRPKSVTSQATTWCPRFASTGRSAIAIRPGCAGDKDPHRVTPRDREAPRLLSWPGKPDSLDGERVTAPPCRRRR